MTTPTQGEVRTWARAQGMTVNDRGSLPAAVRVAYDAAHSGTPGEPPPSTAPAAPSGLSDLAGGLLGLLAAIDTEVRAVSALSEGIDALVAELNDLRAEQAKRLAALDALRDSVTDANLGAFLAKAITPKKARVPEVVPERLQ